MSSDRVDRILTKTDIDSILQMRQSSFTPTYWDKHVADNNHYKLVIETKSPPDYRLLYDSWLWRYVFDTATQWKRDALILELLPGMSLTIPVALQSAQFHGTLVRLNDEPPQALPATLYFAERWIPDQLAALISYPLGYDMIVGNHIIDDLLFNLYLPDLETRKRCYHDPHLCKEVWESLVISGSLSLYQTQLSTIFLNMVAKMNYPSTLILRHYPSTFALTSGDLARINVEMETFFLVTKAISACDQSVGFFLDDSRVSVPPGSTYPDGIFVLEKKYVLPQ